MIPRFFCFQKPPQGFFLSGGNHDVFPCESSEGIQNLLLYLSFVRDALYLSTFLGADDTEGGRFSFVRNTGGVFKKIDHKHSLSVHHRLLYRNSPPLHAFPAERGKRHCLYLFQIHALASLQEIFQTDANAFLGFFRRCLRICR